MEKLGIEEGEVLEHPWLNKSIETAQRRVEQQNFMMRKRTLEYDDVMNAQRGEIYDFRSEALTCEIPRELIYHSAEQAISAHAADVSTAKTKEDCHLFVIWANTTFPLGLREKDLPEDFSPDSLTTFVMGAVKKAYELKATHENTEALVNLERQMIIQSIDEHWQEYLRNMDSLRESVGLQAYGQRDPLIEYKREAYNLFMDLMDRIYEEIATAMFRSATSVEAIQEFFQQMSNMRRANNPQASALASATAQAQAQQQAAAAQAPAPAPAPRRRPQPMGAPPPGMELPQAPQPQPARQVPNASVGRNDPCPCGSGRKYKKCCGAE
jgi:preprotein translocase subunit SecA